MANEAQAPDIKQAGKEIAEIVALATVEKIVEPYVKFYAAKYNLGTMLDGFIEGLIEKLNSDVIDKIDGKDDIKE